MAEQLGIGNKTFDLKLGESFNKLSPVAFHSIRYDFKPASVDTSQVSSVDIGENHSVTVTVPHVEGAGTSHTVYKGNKRPLQKECVLIIDHNTGEITLEKLANTIQLKKTRSEMPSRMQQSNRPITPVDPKPSPQKKERNSPPSSNSNAPTLAMNGPLFSAAPIQNTPPQKTSHDDSSSNSSSSGSDSSSSEDEADDNKNAPPSPPTLQPAVAPAPPQAPPARSHHSRPHFHSTLSDDLRLSESGSDSD